jgi:hypothetical protein
VLNESIDPYDLSLGFRRTFGHAEFLKAVDEELLQLLESGTLNVRPRFMCTSAHILQCRSFANY